MVTSTESQALRSTTKDNKRQYETKIKEERRVLDQLEWTPEEEAIPNLRVIRREKKYKTNLEYFTLSPKVSPALAGERVIRNKYYLKL